MQGCPQYNTYIGSFEIQWVRQYLVNVVLVQIKECENIWNDCKAQKLLVRWTCEYFF